MTEKFEPARIVKFDGRNYQLWKFSVSIALKSNELMEIVSGKERRPEESEENNAIVRRWDQRNNHAMVLFLTSICEEQLNHLVNCETATDMWNKLISIHEQKTEVSKHVVYQKFYDIRMNAGMKIATFISEIESLVKQLEEMGEKISEVAKISKIINSLPPKYDMFVTAWDSVESSKQTLTDLIARLMKEEQKNSMKDESEATLALQIESLKLNPSSTVHSRKQNIQKLKQKTKCGFCKQTGHWWRECPDRKGNKSGKSREQPSGAKRNAEALICDFSLLIEEFEDDQETWLADSGASAHMCFHPEWFTSLKPIENDIVVRVADNKILKPVNIGDINIKAYVNGEWKKKILTDVLYIPELRRNLLSVGKITGKGFTMVAKHDKCEFLNEEGELSCMGIKQGNMFKMMIKIDSHYDCNSVTLGTLKLWHERLGHINLKTIKDTIQKGAVEGAKFHNDDDETDTFCEGCQFGKQTRRSFPENSESRKFAPGEFIHTDVCGPMNVNSPSQSKYFLIFKDDCTNFRMVYFLKQKSEVSTKFKEFEQLVKRQTGNLIKILRSDNGKEYVNKDMTDYLQKNGIVHELSAPYAHEQNGKSEREIRTITESARSMIHAKNVPIELWAEAVSTAVYVLNRIISKHSQLGITPYEQWFGKKPSIHHMKIFGAAAYMHVPKELNKKWDPKSKKMIFVGYHQNSSNYRLWDPEKRRIFISTNVKFDEANNITRKDGGNGGNMIVELICENEDELKVDDEAEEQSVEEISSEENHNRSVIVADEELENYEGNNGMRYNLRDRRKIQAPRFLQDAMFAEIENPSTYNEAVNSDNSKNWISAMKDEIDALRKNKTWSLVPIPEDGNIVPCKWVYCIKNGINGKQKFKARLVAKGFSQREGIDYQETYAPVVRYESIRILLAIAVEEDLEIAQFDVKTAFLYGELEETILMQQPEGFEEAENLICKLNKSLYGLKQSPRCWNHRFKRFLEIFGMKQTDADPCIFLGCIDGFKVYISLYVDDGLILTKSKYVIEKILSYLRTDFEITIGDAKCYVGFEIERNRLRNEMFICQESFITKALKKFNMSECVSSSIPAEPGTRMKKPDANNNSFTAPYREAIGTLLYIALNTRPDIAYSVNFLSQFNNAFSHEHWKAVKKIFRYLKNTNGHGILYRKSSDGNLQLSGYTDADYGGDLDTRKSRSGYIFLMNESPITWISKRQSVVALSTTEAEYIALSLGVREVIWLRRLLDELGFPQENATRINVDNQSAIKLVSNPEFHQRTKHIDIKYHFVREAVENGAVCISFIESKLQLADILTKPLPREKIYFIRSALKICDPYPYPDEDIVS